MKKIPLFLLMIGVLSVGILTACSSGGGATDTSKPAETASETLPDNPDSGANAPADSELGGGE